MAPAPYLKTCSYPDWAFIKSAKIHRKECRTPTREKQNDKQNNIVIPYIAALSEKLRCFVLFCFSRARHPGALQTQPMFKFLYREDRWSERAVKEAHNTGGGLQHQLSATYREVLRSLLRWLNSHYRLVPGDPGPSR